jgi:NAD(P)-dependent dehydrogenase (short-subunit alcohol dehydrogenase family)
MSGEDASGRMAGKCCVVTGATAGIGLVTARELARMGARVLIVGRSPERCARSVEEIRALSGSSSVESLVADLSRQADVRRLASEIEARVSHLDVLVNNAGGIFLNRQESADGIEMTFALNHVSYFLLTSLLLPLLKTSAPSRIVNVASDAHRGVSIDFDQLQGAPRYRGWRAYQWSKLANLLFTFELSRRLKGTGVTVNALHPGFVRTSIFRDPGPIGWIIRRSADWLAIPPEKGALTSIYLASSPEVEGISGKYFAKQKPAIPASAAYDLDAAVRLWNLSQQLTKLE